MGDTSSDIVTIVSLVTNAVQSLGIAYLAARYGGELKADRARRRRS